MAQLEKIMSIYYGSNKLPYKDEDRQIHYPIAGETNTFVGENNTTKVRFYVDKIGGSNYTWVVKVKKPNGTICFRVLEMDNDDYVDVDLSFLYTDQVGQIDLALNGYTTRDITITENDGDYEISGNPIVICTGIIKVIINYAPLILNMGASVQPNEYQQILALLSTKLSYGVESEKVNELPTTGKANTIYYVKSNESDIVYDIYYWNGTTFAYLGTTAYDLYTKEDGTAFENALRSYVNTQLGVLETEIQQVASGSPKGTYATLSDLETAYPTGTEGIYVVLADGHWYYWNGSAWTDGGVYLSTSNAVPETRKVAGYTLENDITVQELKEKIYIYLFNLYTNGDFLQAGVVDGNNTTRTIDNGILKVLASARYGWAGKNFSFNVGDVVYCSMKVKSSIVTDRDVVVNFQRQTGNQQILYRNWVSKNNQWERFSGIGTATESGSDYRFQVYDNRSSAFTEIDIDDCVVINLTQCFGAGKEPSFEEIDNVVEKENGYFEKYEYISFTTLKNEKLDKDIYYDEIIDEKYNFSNLTENDILFNIIPTKLNGVFEYSSPRATLKKLLKVKKGTRFHSTGTLSFNVFVYDENMTLVFVNDSYIQDYTTTIDCYIRLVYSNGTNLENIKSMLDIDIPKQLIKPFRLNPNEVAQYFNLIPKDISWQFNTLIVVGHQGNRQYGVGNTLPAIVGARKSNFSIVEGDVRKNIYGEYFMYHNDNLSPSSLTYDEYAKDINGYLIYKDNENNHYFYDSENETLYTYDYENKEYVASSVDIATLTQCKYREIVVNNERVNFLKRIDINNSYPLNEKEETLLTFKEWLLLNRKLGLRCSIDRKFEATQENYQEIIQIVKDLGMKNDVYWIATTITIANWVRNELPSAKLIYDFGETFPNISTQSSIATLKLSNIDDSLIVVAQAGKINNDYVIQETNVKSWLNNDVIVGCWNYLTNTQTKQEMLEEIERLINLGVSYFVWDIYSPYELFNEKYKVYNVDEINKIK